MERHIRLIAPGFEDRDDQMPDLDSITPLLSPPLIFRNGKIVARKLGQERQGMSKPEQALPKRVGAR